MFNTTMHAKTTARLIIKFVSGKMWLENNPNLELPKYLNKSRCPNGVNANATDETSPLTTTPTIDINALTNTESVVDLKINDNIIANDI